MNGSGSVSSSKTGTQRCIGGIRYDTGTISIMGLKLTCE